MTTPTKESRGLRDGEALARKFHEAYERLAPQFGYETRTETRDFNPESANGKLMIAVCAALSAPESVKPVAWHYVLFGEDQELSVIISDEHRNPFGKPGLDYSKSYEVIETPLYAHPKE